MLSLQHDERIRMFGDTTPLLLDVVEQVKQRGSIKQGVADGSCQTEDIGSEGLSLDQKLRNIDYGLMEKVQIERAMPFKSLEERMEKFKRQQE